jgi:hypothetical protein
MRDESNYDTVIELIAKALDEPLSPREQALVDQAMQESLAIRVAAEGLHEFDLLLKRTGMAIPVEGFPARVLARIEAYEKRRTRTEWLLTLLMVFLGFCAAAVWLSFNYTAVADGMVQALTTLFVVLPVWLNVILILAQALGSGALLLYALLVLVLMLLWARATGGSAAVAESTVTVTNS